MVHNGQGQDVLTKTAPDMERWRVLLLHSRNFNWVGLRATLRDERGVRIVGDVADVDQAVRQARELRPDAMLVAGDLEDSPIVEAARRLREASRGSKIIVLDDLGDQETLASLGRVPTDGYVTWDNVDSEVVHAVLVAVLQGGLRVESPDAAHELVTLPEDRDRAHQHHIALTDQEREILSALASDGLLEGEIARQKGMSLPTVQRAIHSLKRKLHARTLCELGARARDLGFSPRWP